MGRIGRDERMKEGRKEGRRVEREASAIRDKDGAGDEQLRWR